MMNWGLDRLIPGGELVFRVTSLPVLVLLVWLGLHHLSWMDRAQKYDSSKLLFYLTLVIFLIQRVFDLTPLFLFS